jgi:hypothetical protein
MNGQLIWQPVIQRNVSSSNSPNDQPPLQDRDPLFDLLFALPEDGKMNEFTDKTYHRIFLAI